MNHVVKVIRLAREIDELSLAVRKDNASKNWYQKAMKDAELLLDEDEMYPFFNLVFFLKPSGGVTLKQTCYSQCTCFWLK